MNFTTNQLEANALVVSLSIKRWTGRKVDKSASEDVTSGAGAKRGTARVTKDIIDREAIKEIDVVYTRAVRELQSITLPWDDAGARLVPGPRVLQLRLKLEAMRTEFFAKVQALARNYGELRAEAAETLGSLFNHDDYPPAYTIPEKFAFNIHFTPVPTNDIRVAMPDSLRETIQREMDVAVNQRLEAATAATFQRVHDTIKRLHTITSSDKPRFHDSLESDVRDLVDILPDLNLTGDPRLAALADTMRLRFAGVTVDDLRSDEVFRAKVAEDSESVLDMLSGML